MKKVTEIGIRSLVIVFTVAMTLSFTGANAHAFSSRYIECQELEYKLQDLRNKLTQAENRLDEYVKKHGTRGREYLRLLEAVRQAEKAFLIANGEYDRLECWNNDPADFWPNQVGEYVAVEVEV